MATLAFDVYGTLIDTDGVVSRLREWIGTQAEVFSQTLRSKQLEYSFRRGLMRRYENHQAGAAPKYIVCDRESIFDCDAFRRWVKRKGIKPPRYGAVGRHGSLAVVERLILTLKNECTRRLVVPMRRAAFGRELHWFTRWYNEYRPHMTLAGATPDEIYFRLRAAHRQPRIEPRKDWPRPSPCAQPRTLVAGQPGDRFDVEIGQLGRRRHLPIVSLQRAA